MRTLVEPGGDLALSGRERAADCRRLVDAVLLKAAVARGGLWNSRLSTMRSRSGIEVGTNEVQNHVDGTGQA